jgi:hypothetical protein
MIVASFESFGAEMSPKRSPSRRDAVIVARQFIAWNVLKRRPVPQGRCEPRYPTCSAPGSKTSRQPNHTVPTGRVARWTLPRQ